MHCSLKAFHSTCLAASPGVQHIVVDIDVSHSNHVLVDPSPAQQSELAADCYDTALEIQSTLHLKAPQCVTLHCGDVSEAASGLLPLTSFTVPVIK